MSLKRVEKKKILGRHYKIANWLFNYFKKTQPPEMFYKKAVLLKVHHGNTIAQGIPSLFSVSKISLIS